MFVVVGTRNNTHNTIQLHTLLNVVVVGTRNNTHNTIQLHTLLNVVVVGTRNNTHNTIQLHTLLNVVVVGTRNNTHNTIQLHTLLNVVVVGIRNNTHNTIQLHTLLNVVVVGTRNNTHNTIQLHTLLMLLLCVTYEPSYTGALGLHYIITKTLVTLQNLRFFIVHVCWSVSFFVCILSSNDVQATILVRSFWFCASWCILVQGPWQKFLVKIGLGIFFFAMETNRSMMRDRDFSILWYFIARLLVYISLWIWYRTHIGW